MDPVLGTVSSSADLKQVMAVAVPHLGSFPLFAMLMALE